MAMATTWAAPASRPDAAPSEDQTAGSSHKERAMVQTPVISHTQESDSVSATAHRRARIDPTPRMTNPTAIRP